jgi:glycosyltransferase involved in cell wall biosynthesis
MLDLSLAKHFAWLLRSDVRQDIKSSDKPSERFAQWWLVNGRSEYPYWDDLNSAQINWLQEAVGTVSIEGAQASIPQMMRLVLAWRPDVIQKFSSDGNADANLLAAWFFLMGMQEHRLAGAISLDLIRQLDSPVIHGKQEANDDVPATSVLMALAWRLLGPDLQKAMNLSDSAARNRYLAWFFTAGLGVFKCHDLIANRWRSWLLQPIPIGSGLGELPRFALLEYSSLPPKKRPDIATVAGVERLRAWSVSPGAIGSAKVGDAKSSIVQGKWAWLKQPTQIPRANVIPKPAVSLLTDGAAVLPATVKKPFGVNLFGFAYGELGIGEDLRMAVACCEAAGVAYRVINIEPGTEIRQNDKAVQAQVEQGVASAPYAINVFILPGFDIASRVFLKMGSEVFKDHYNVGWCPWELGVWPAAWNRAFELVDEVWAGSQFSHEMYTRSTKKPAIPMPLATQLLGLQKKTRKHFGLPANEFLFLYVFDFNSHLERKNPNAVLEGFATAFPKAKAESRGGSKVGLVLKVMNAKPSDPAWQKFEKSCKSDKRIHLIDQTMDRGEVLALINVCDAYVSPHRAEGFGRTLTEAMLLGKPVVATNYSGNAFYMNPEVTFPVDYELVPVKRGDYHFVEDEDGAVWADPSITHLASQMQAAIAAAKDPQFKANLLAYAQQTFAPQRTGQLMQARLESIKTLLIERGLV